MSPLETKLVEALLAVEYPSPFHVTDDDDARLPGCPGCGMWGAEREHRGFCPIDAALKAAGYPDYESRCKARQEIYMRTAVDNTKTLKRAFPMREIEGQRARPAGRIQASWRAVTGMNRPK